jgi:glycosyltransferase involved in cell wall biosynthesis
MAPRLNADLRWKLYKRLAGRPGLVSYMRARKYDRREFLREWLGQRNERELLEQVRAGRDVCWIEGDDPEPLVTVVIPTYQRPDTIERAVESTRGQTYERLEILVVGDHTDDRTAQILAAIRDARLRFVNLPHQGIYPGEARLRGLVSGSTPMNVGLDLAAGAWVANCDDDDELLPNHVEVLLGDAKRRRLEMVYSRFEVVDYPPPNAAPGTEPRVSIGGSEPMRFAVVARGAVLYSLGLRFMKYETECWRIRDPHDWNLWKRMLLAGVRIGFNEAVTYRYHRQSGMAG